MFITLINVSGHVKSDTRNKSIQNQSFIQI